jgi:hypothetical protein
MPAREKMLHGDKCAFESMAANSFDRMIKNCNYIFKRYKFDFFPLPVVILWRRGEDSRDVGVFPAVKEGEAAAVGAAADV